VRSLAGPLRHQPGVESVRRELNQRVGESAFAAAVIFGSGRTSERLQRRAQSSPARRVQPPVYQQRPVLTRTELQPAPLDGVRFVGGEALRVRGVANVMAEAPEPTHAQRFRLVQHELLVKTLRRVGTGQRLRGAGEHGHVSKANLTVSQCLAAQREARQLLPHADAVRRGAAAHLALVANPLDGAD